MDHVVKEKKRLRTQLRERLLEIPQHRRREESDAAVRRITALPEWSESTVVLTFVAMSHQGEIETSELLCLAGEQGKRIALPRIHGGELEFREVKVNASGTLNPSLELHSYGVEEPPESAPLFEPAPEETVLVVTPGLAFDRAGGRLGRGKGFYDGWLHRNRHLLSRATLRPVGFGYEEQLIEQVPMDEGDVFLPRLVLGDMTIDCER